jgi:hypothetical protein
MNFPLDKERVAELEICSELLKGFKLKLLYVFFSQILKRFRSAWLLSCKAY